MGADAGLCRFLTFRWFRVGSLSPAAMLGGEQTGHDSDEWT